MLGEDGSANVLLPNFMISINEPYRSRRDGDGSAELVVRKCIRCAQILRNAPFHLSEFARLLADVPAACDSKWYFTLTVTPVHLLTESGVDNLFAEHHG